MSVRHLGLDCQYTPTKYTGTPVRVIATPIPTSKGLATNGKHTRKPQIIRKTIGKTMLT